MPKGLRKRKIDDCPNRLFLSYLESWRDDAEKTSNLFHVYNKAYKSLLKYPLPLQSGKDAMILENFGKTLCSKLDSKLNEEAQLQKLSPREYLEQTRNIPDSWWNNSKIAKLQVSKPKNAGKMSKKNLTNCNYIPNKNSGSYGILLALCKDHQSHSSKGFMTKQELQQAAQVFTTKSFIIAERGSFYTAWSGMKTLIVKELVKKYGNPAKYMLTDKGLQLAQKLVARISAENDFESVKTYSLATSTSSKSSSLPDISYSENKSVKATLVDLTNELDNYTSASNDGHVRDQTALVDLTLDSDDSYAESNNAVPNYSVAGTSRSICCFDSAVSANNCDLERNVQFELGPGQFDILLCIDYREICGSGKSAQMLKGLEKLGVPYVRRNLHVGDFLWIAKSRCGDPKKELVLDQIVERKSISDLAQSICDRRFSEQRIRLRRSGLKKMLLIEEKKQIGHQSIPAKSLAQAIYNAQINDSFVVKYCSDVSATAKFLQLLTSGFQSEYQHKTLKAYTFEDRKKIKSKCNLFRFADFNDRNMKSKRLTVNNFFAKKLMVLNGLSCKNASAITAIYHTPGELLKAYASCPTEDAKKQLLSKVKACQLKRNFGISLSTKVFEVYCGDK